MTLNLPPDIRRRLQRAAKRHGVFANAYALRLTDRVFFRRRSRPRTNEGTGQISAASVRPAGERAFHKQPLPGCAVHWLGLFGDA